MRELPVGGFLNKIVSQKKRIASNQQARCTTIGTHSPQSALLYGGHERDGPDEILLRFVKRAFPDIRDRPALLPGGGKDFHLWRLGARDCFFRHRARQQHSKTRSIERFAHGMRSELRKDDAAALAF